MSDVQSIRHECMSCLCGSSVQLVTLVSLPAIITCYNTTDLAGSCSNATCAGNCRGRRPLTSDGSINSGTGPAENHFSGSLWSGALLTNSGVCCTFTCALTYVKRVVHFLSVSGRCLLLSPCLGVGFLSGCSNGSTSHSQISYHKLSYHCCHLP